MTTTELINLLKRVEFGASGRPREISFHAGDEYLFQPYISISSTGDGICGAELNLILEAEEDDFE